MTDRLGLAFGAAASNPLHMISGPDTRWTRVNFAEAVQGVQKPLDWGFWEQGLEVSLRTNFVRMGALSRGRAAIPVLVDERFSGIFFGRVAGNVDMFRYVADRLPGSNGDQLEEKMFGKPAPADAARKPLSAVARYPIVAARTPFALRTPVRVLPGLRAENHAWWEREVLDSPPRELERARALLRDACRRFIQTLVAHGVPTMLSGQLLEALGAFAQRATGDASVGLALATGLGSMEETGLITDVYRAAHGQMEIDELIRRHGNHGPDAGNLSSVSWREDRAPLETYLSSFRGSAASDPREREREQQRQRERAQAEVLAGLPPHARAAARLTARLARIYIPLREVAKASFLVAIDGGRCAARAIGARLAEAGTLADAEDVFFLTLPEALGQADGDLRALIDQRREVDACYGTLELPLDWTGNPEPTAPASAVSTGTASEVSGIGVFGNEPVTGRAHVVSDPRAVELKDGEILVCATTDPSWTPLFMVASAVVIDTGGAISHGAIVARELGVPCVIGTGTGTRVIPDGAQITVDGRRGLVSIVPASD
jgi:phosphohistidine swiveling domain-containing protein